MYIHFVYRQPAPHLYREVPSSLPGPETVGSLSLCDFISGLVAIELPVSFCDRIFCCSEVGREYHLAIKLVWPADVAATPLLDQAVSSCLTQHFVQLLERNTNGKVWVLTYFCAQNKVLYVELKSQIDVGWVFVGSLELL